MHGGEDPLARSPAPRASHRARLMVERGGFNGSWGPRGQGSSPTPYGDLASSASRSSLHRPARASRRPPACPCTAPEGTAYHDLRHFYASLLVRQGESVEVVQARLGHATAAETLDTYSHLWPDSEDRIRAAVDSVLGAPADAVRTGAALSSVSAGQVVFPGGAGR
jgi:integrase